MQSDFYRAVTDWNEWQWQMVLSFLSIHIQVAGCLAAITAASVLNLAPKERRTPLTRKHLRLIVTTQAA